MSRLAIKVDVDTDRGTRDGILPLAHLLRQHHVPALFLFSLGPDNMGKSVRRIFQPGFLKKVTRTRVIGQYGLRTLLNGTLLPAPHLGRRYGPLMRMVRDMGFETGIHCYDHYRWQNHVQGMSLAETRAEFGRAVMEFERIFGSRPSAAGAPGWQCTEHSLQVYDEFGLTYASDTRGSSPFFPRIGEKVFTTLQLPSTLPTLDELIGRPEYPQDSLMDHYFQLMSGQHRDHVLTIHAELEGIHFQSFLTELLERARKTGMEFFSLGELAQRLREASRAHLPVCDVRMTEIDGRSGVVATQSDPGLHRN